MNRPTTRRSATSTSSFPKRPASLAKALTDSRKIARHTKWRNIWIDRKFLVVECVPEEIETHHLGDLKKDIFYANSKYREYLRHQAHADHRSAQTQSLERDRLRDMKSRLNFD